MTNAYCIDARIDHGRGEVTGFERISLDDRSSKYQKGLLLSFNLQAVEGYPRLEVSVKGQPVDLLPTEAKSLEQERQFYIELPERVPTESKVTLDCVFRGKLPAPQRGIVSLIDDWHPKVRGDRMTFDDYEVTATLPKGQVLISTGSETVIEPPSGQQTRYNLMAEKVKDFGLLTNEGLGVVEQRAEDVLVKSYYLPETERWGRPLLSFACDAISFYREEFGFYPQRKLSIMPGEKESVGGWPITSNVVAIHDLDKLGAKGEPFARWIMAHEVGHQYWGGYVACLEPPSDDGLGWLCIGLGIYMDRCYAEARGLGMDHHGRARMGRYVQGLREGVDTTVMQPPERLEAAGFDYNNVVIHSKGYAVISMLEQLLGRGVFRRVFDEALRRFKHRDMRSRDFQLLCEELSGEQLDWFFYEWLYTNRYLSYRVASQEQSKEAETYRLKARVERLADARMSIPVQVTFQDGAKAIQWTNRALRVSELLFTGPLPVVKLELDPEGRFPLVYPPLDPTEMDVVREISALPWIQSGEAAKRVYEKACRAGLKTESLWFKLGMMLYDGEYYGEALEAFKRTQELDGDPTYTFLAILWRGHVHDLLGERAEALGLYKGVVQKLKETGFEGEVRHDQYGLVINRRWVEERLKTPFQRTD